MRTLIDPYALSVEWRLIEQDKAHRYSRRDYCVQYGETDYQFLSRLCSDWGINFWFEHNQETHTLVFSDDEQGHKPNLSEAYRTVSYYPPKHKTTEEYLHEFNLIAQMVSGAYSSSDYDYTRPKTDLLSKADNTQLPKLVWVKNQITHQK